MKSNFINIISEQKQRYHKKRAKIAFEEKVRDIIEMQKIDIEFSKNRKTPLASYKKVWKID